MFRQVVHVRKQQEDDSLKKKSHQMWMEEGPRTFSEPEAPVSLPHWLSFPLQGISATPWKGDYPWTSDGSDSFVCVWYMCVRMHIFKPLLVSDVFTLLFFI